MKELSELTVMGLSEEEIYTCIATVEKIREKKRLEAQREKVKQEIIKGLYDAAEILSRKQIQDFIETKLREMDKQHIFG